MREGCGERGKGSIAFDTVRPFDLPCRSGPLLVGLRHTQNDCPAPAGFFSLGIAQAVPLGPIRRAARAPGWGGVHEIAPRGDESRHAGTADRAVAQPPELRPRLNKLR
jgi:hypothetical protein